MRQLITLAFILILASCSQGSSENGTSAPKKSIHEAAFFGDLSTIKQHISAGSDLNIKDEYGSTALNIAITFNKEDVAIALINGDADLSVTAPGGSTPLHAATFFGRTNIIKALLEKGVDQSATDDYGATALQSALIPFEDLKPVYDQISKDLGPLGLKLDYAEIVDQRKEIAALLQK
jgi:hypothetical protein